MDQDERRAYRNIRVDLLDLADKYGGWDGPARAALLTALADEVANLAHAVTGGAGELGDADGQSVAGRLFFCGTLGGPHGAHQFVAQDGAERRCVGSV